MIVLTSANDGLRMAVNPADIIFVYEKADHCSLQVRVSPAVTSANGILCLKVKEPFAGVMKAILDYQDDKRYRAEQRSRLV